MKLLRTITDLDFNPQAPVVDTTNFRTRRAARAVLLDPQGAVYLLEVRKYGYHKLPGGGIEPGEDIREALTRELLEEVGCTADVVAELGIVVEHYYEAKLTQTSYCFLTKQTGKKLPPAFDSGEIAHDFAETKAKSVDDAIRLLSSDRSTQDSSQFIRLRDLTFLKAAKSALQ